MTDAEINRKVAEAAGYELDPTSGPGFIRAIVRRSEGDGWETSYSWAFNPRHDANQAIEALRRVFDEYLWGYSQGTHQISGYRNGTWEESVTDFDFCRAACNAILAVTE